MCRIPLSGGSTTLKGMRIETVVQGEDAGSQRRLEGSIRYFIIQPSNNEDATENS